MANHEAIQNRGGPAPENEEVREEAVEAVSDSTSGEMTERMEAGGSLARIATEAARHALEEARAQGVTIEEAAAGVARGAITAAIEYDRGVAESAITSGICGALEAAHEAGEDLARVAHGAVRAGLEAAARAGLDFALITESLGRTVIQSTPKTGEALADVAVQTVAGAIDAARELELSPEDAAVSAATGVIEAAGAHGPATAHMIRGALAGPINGVEVVLRQPTRRDPEALGHEGGTPNASLG